MNFDCADLVGQSLTLVQREGGSWSFHFSGGSLISTEEPWRLLTPEGLHVSSLDDLEGFGLCETVNAAERVTEALQGEAITAAAWDSRSGDLNLHLNGERTLQFLQLSAGYESWRLVLNDGEFICLGGGVIAEFPHSRAV